MSYDNYEEELLARVRRIETRLSIFMEAQGVPSQVRRPERRRDGSIEVPTRGSPIQEILPLIELGDTITVHCNGVDVCRITKL
jgi:hypothetical protein